MKKKPFSLCKRAKSFRYAFQGLAILLRDEHNARLHLFFALLAIALGSILQISTTEWLFIIACIGAVFAAETFNTALEALCNRVTTDQDPLIKKSKDCAAAATFLLAMASLAIGIIIFAPKLDELIRRMVTGV